MLKKIKDAFALPVSSDDVLGAGRAGLLNIILWVGMSGSLLVLFGDLLGKRTPLLVSGVNIFTIFILLILWSMLKRGLVLPTSYLLIGAWLVVITFALVQLGTVRSPTTSSYLLVVVVSGLLFDWWGLLISTCLCSLAVAGLVFAESSGWLPAADYSVNITQWVTYTAAFFAMSAVMFYFIFTIKRAVHLAANESAERIKKEAALLRAAEEWRTTFDAMQDAVCLLDADQRIIRCNRTMAEMFHRNYNETLGKYCWEIVHHSSQPVPECPLSYMRLSTQREMTELLIDGRWLQVTVDPFFDKNHDLAGAVHAIRDITEKKKEEARVQRLSRAMRVISVCNHRLVSATSEIEWLNELCDILITRGGYRMAWIGYAEEEEPKRVWPVAHAGFEDGYLEGINITWRDETQGRGPTGTAIRTGQPVLARNIPTDPAYEPWRRAAIQRGYVSSLALPLADGEVKLGALNVYAMEADAFDHDEVELLMQLAWDLSYGITALRTRGEKEEAEVLLRESEERYRLLYENSLDAILLTAPDGSILSANPAACRMFGRSEQEICDIGRYGLVDRKDPRLPVALEERTRTGRFVGELTFLRKSGETFPCEVASALFSDRTGQTRTSMIIRDISEHKRTEQLLRESEAYHRALFESSPIGLALCRMDGRLVDVNQAYADILGRTVEETLQLTYWEITPDQYSASERVQLALLEKDGKYGPYEKEYVHKDGHLVPVLLRGLIIERNGEKYIWSSVENTSEQKGAEARLRDSEERLRLFIEHAPAAMAMLDRDMNYLAVSNRWIQDYRLSVPLIGQNYYEKFPEIPDHWKAAHRRCLMGTVEKSDGELFRRQDGSINWLKWEIRPWFEQSGKIGGIVIFTEDITESMAANEALRQSESNLKEAQAIGRIGNWEFNPLNQKVTWSDQTYVLYGRNPRLGPPTPEEETAYYAPEQVGVLHEYARLALEEGQSFDYDLEARLPGGKTAFFAASMRPVLDSSGRVVKLVGTVQDITTRKQLEEALQKRVHELGVVYESARHLQTLLPSSLLAGKLIEVMEATLGYEYGAVLLVDERDGSLLPFSLSRQGKSLEYLEADRDYVQSHHTVLGKGVTGWVAAHGESLRLGEVNWDSRYIPMRENIHSELCVPLRIQDKVIGVVNVESSRPNAYSEDDQRLLETIAAQMAVSIQNSRLLGQLQRNTLDLEERVLERTAQVEHFLRQQAASEERQRLARELHDTVSQTLFSASLIAESLPRLQGKDSQTLSEGLGDLQRLTRGALAEMRALLLELRPGAIQGMRLQDLLYQAANSTMGRTQLKVDVDTALAPNPPVEVRLACFRVVQEALNNIIRHAHARHVALVCRELEPAPVIMGASPLPGLALIIRDDGQGFDPATASQPGHHGLDIMRERMTDIGGHVTVHSLPGGGAEITLTWRGMFEEKPI